MIVTPTIPYLYFTDVKNLGLEMKSGIEEDQRVL
jgi:hypothetical protein